MRPENRNTRISSGKTLLEDLKNMYPDENSVDSLLERIEKEIFRLTNVMTSDKFTQHTERIKSVRERISRFRLYEKLVHKILGLNYDFVSDIPEELIFARL